MTWIFFSDSGAILHDNVLVGEGYAGAGEGRNNPVLESVPNVGPIPRGDWLISAPFDTETHGPYVMRLHPMPETRTFGRSGFLVHGDSRAAPGTASLGCIVTGRPIRVQMWQSGDHNLRVTSA